MGRQYELHRSLPHLDGRWSYRVRRGGAAVEDVRVNRDELVVPETLDGLPVTELTEHCFAGMNLSCVWLPGTLERIGCRAFGDCEELQAAVIPASVCCIDETAFDGCPELCLFVTEGSYAHRFAEQLELPFCFGLPETDMQPEDSIVCGDFIYGLSDEGEAIIREYTGSARTLLIPDELDGLPVAGLAGCSFARSETLEEVVVPEGVTVVGGYAFSESPALRRIVLPSSLRHLGLCCFLSCPALESVRMSGDLQVLNLMTFAECTALREIVLPEGLEAIDPMCFAGCRSLTEIRLPAGLESVAGSAFCDCRRLRTPALPAGLSEDSRAAFRSCVDWTEEPDGSLND
ncbi:MAG: leucine-rich repeat protein [Clostridia bacterium]|nr:leucine-rich repeat protein [Clostridia bacterium]